MVTPSGRRQLSFKNYDTVNDLQQVDDTDLIRMFYIINDEYVKYIQDDTVLPGYSDQIIRLGKKLKDIISEVQKRHLSLQRP